MAASDMSLNVVDRDGSQSTAGIRDEEEMNASLRESHKCIGRFFYEMGIDFEFAHYPSFKNMINATLGKGKEDYPIPNSQHLKGWILEEVLQEMLQYVEEIKNSWTKTGCSILLDEWTDENGRNLVNILVDCPRGQVYLRSSNVSDFGGDDEALQLVFDQVIEEVGEDNVVQVIAGSTTGWTEAFREQFEERHNKVFWSVSASHCIGLMLDNIGKMVHVKETLDKAKTITKFVYSHATVLKLLRSYTQGQDLIKPSKIKSAAPFLTLENMVLLKQNLEEAFASPEWKHSVWTSRLEGKKVADLIRKQSFWGGAMIVLKAAMPLVNALSLINKADKPTIGYIYETMDQVKETIRDEEFREDESQYMPIWDAIDEIWNTYLHSDLHVMGYYLNPSFFYSEEFHSDAEVSNGQLSCTVRMIDDQRIQHLISKQLKKYQEANGAFKKGSAFESRNTPPAEWWLTYGNHCPELQNFSIKVVSQTCDGASRFGLKRSVAEKLLAQGRNPIEEKLLKDLAFVHYNLQLQNFEPSKNGDVIAEEIDPTDDWIVCDGPVMMGEDDESAWMDLD